MLQHTFYTYVNIKNSEGKTPLHLALTSVLSKDKFFFRNPNLEIIKLLIEHGADVNSKDNLNETPLHYILKQQISSNIKQIFERYFFIDDSEKHAILKLL